MVITNSFWLLQKGGVSCARWEGHRLLLGTATPTPQAERASNQELHSLAALHSRTQGAPRTITADPSYVCIPCSKVREIHLRLQLQPSIRCKIWVLQMLPFSWLQTSRNFDLQPDTATKTKQMADCELIPGIQSQEHTCIRGIFATLCSNVMQH